MSDSESPGWGSGADTGDAGRPSWPVGSASAWPTSEGSEQPSEVQSGQPPYAQPPHGQGAPDQPPYGQGAPGQPPYGQPPYAQPPYGQGAPGQPPFGQVQDPAVYGQRMDYAAPAAPDIGSAFSWAISTTKRFWKPLAALGAIGFGGMAILMGLYFAALVVLFASTTTSFSESSTSYGSGPPVLIIFGLYAAIFVGAIAIQAFSSAIMTSAGKQIVNGVAPTVRSAFSGVPWIRVMVASFVGAILSLVGMAACIIPGLLISFALRFIPVAIIDDDLSVSDAFSQVYKLAKSRPETILLGGFIAGIMAQAGAMACYIGLVLSMPFAELFVYHLYRGSKGATVTHWAPQS